MKWLLLICSMFSNTSDGQKYCTDKDFIQFTSSTTALEYQASLPPELQESSLLYTFPVVQEPCPDCPTCPDPEPCPEPPPCPDCPPPPEVKNIPPIISADWMPRTGDAPFKVLFVGADADIDGKIVSRMWDFGDGDTYPGASVEHTYIKPGIYTAKYQIVDSSNSFKSLQFNIKVTTPPVPEPPISVPYYQGIEWDTVTTNTDGTPIDNLKGYYVYQSTTSFNQEGFISTQTASMDSSIQKIFIPKSSTSYSAGPLTPGTSYYFRNTAINSSNVESGFNVDEDDKDVEIIIYKNAE